MSEFLKANYAENLTHNNKVSCCAEYSKQYPISEAIQLYPRSMQATEPENSQLLRFGHTKLKQLEKWESRSIYRDGLYDHNTNSEMRPDFNIFTAAKLNNATVIYHLLEKEQNNPNERNDVGLTPLHVCATFGSLEAAVILLEFGADLNAVDRESRWTPLHRSIYFRHFKLTLLFIKAGAMLDYGQEEVLNTGNSSSKATTATPQSAIRDYEGLTPMGLLSLMISDTKGDVSRFQRPISSHLEPSNAQLDKLGCIFAFGKADFQLGIALPKALSDVVRPRFVTLPGNESVSSISANRYHSLAVAGDGVVYSWGHGRGGRLGHGDETTQPLPVCIMTLRPQQRVIEVAAGLNHSLALTASGELFSWG